MGREVTLIPGNNRVGAREDVIVVDEDVDIHDFDDV